MPGNPGLDLLLERVRQGLVAAGIPVTNAALTTGAQVWNDFNGASMSSSRFVEVLQYVFSQQGLTGGRGGGGGGGGGGFWVDPKIANEQWAQEQDQYLYIEELRYQTQLDVSNIGDASARYVAELNAAVDREIAAGKITAEQGIRARELAAQEAYWANDIAIRTLISDRQYEIAQAELQLRDREIKAQLAANPADWLTYQAYLRDGELPGVGAAGDVGQGASAEDIRAAAEGLTDPSGALYNPRLAGVGVAGAEVPGPQDISRLQTYNMSPTDIEMLTGFLRGGIEIEGQRVAINPQDWFTQAQKGFVPTVKESSFMPQYA